MATTNSSVAEAGAERKVLDKIDYIVHRYGEMRGATIPILQSIQDEFGYIPIDLLPRVSALTGIASSELFSIITFYAQFRMHPIGENYIQACHGTACHLAGSEEITNAIYRALDIKEGKTSPDGKFTVEKVACLGCCSLAPVININGETFSRLTSEKAIRLVKNYGKNKDTKKGADRSQAEEANK